MAVLQGIRWINRHGAAPALLALLVFLCMAAHFTAVARITMLSDIPLESWPPRFIRNMTGIQFFHSHWWFALTYLLLLVAALLYMESRGTPRWAVWSTFAFLSVPMVGYFLTCLNVGTCFIVVMGPAR